MNDHDAYQDEVEDISLLSDRDLDLLLTGQLPTGWTGEEDLTRFTRDVKRLLATPPSDEVAARHLAAMTDAATAARQAVGRQRDVPSIRATELQGPLRRWRRKAFAAAGILGGSLATLSGAAYAGVLPGPVQRAVADVAGRVGLSLPGAENDRDDGPVEDSDSGPASRRDNEPASNPDGVRPAEQRGEFHVTPVAPGTPSHRPLVDQADNERVEENERVIQDQNDNGRDDDGGTQNRNHNAAEARHERDQSGDVSEDRNSPEDVRGDAVENENDTADNSDNPVEDENDAADQGSDSRQGQDDTGGENNDPVQGEHDNTEDRNDDAGGGQDG